MRWFFLAFLMLLAVTGHAALLDHPSLLTLFGVVVFNIFMLSLGVLWWNAYFQHGETKAKGLIVSHALLMLSLGSALLLIGASAIEADGCRTLLSSPQFRGATARVASYAEYHGLCRPLGLVIAGLGVFLAYPSIRLFRALAR